MKVLDLGAYAVMAQSGFDLAGNVTIDEAEGGKQMPTTTRAEDATTVPMPVMIALRRLRTRRRFRAEAVVAGRGSLLSGLAGSFAGSFTGIGFLGERS